MRLNNCLSEFFPLVDHSTKSSYLFWRRASNGAKSAIMLLGALIEQLLCKLDSAVGGGTVKEFPVTTTTNAANLRQKCLRRRQLREHYIVRRFALRYRRDHGVRANKQVHHNAPHLAARREPSAFPRASEHPTQPAPTDCKFRVPRAQRWRIYMIM